MGWITRIRKSNFLHKLFNWEFWPFGILQGPVFIYWLWLSLRARSLFFFSASNPGILAGGMMGESKYDLMKRLPATVRPKTFLVKLPTNKATVLNILHENKLQYPVIFKPDLGERGWMVMKIESEADVDEYLNKIRVDFIIQEYVNLPLEFGVAYYRFPDAVAGAVNSITAKEFLSVTGDGNSTLGELIDKKPRARLHLETLHSRFGSEWDNVLAAGKRKELVSIGNHVRGTKFINANHLITPQLSASFDNIARHVDGFFFGRFDLRCETVSDLEAGRVMIVELNGCGAEPAHIYHPGYPFWRAMEDLFRHVKLMYLISIANHKRGVPYLSFREGRAIYKHFRQLQS